MTISFYPFFKERNTNAQMNHNLTPIERQCFYPPVYNFKKQKGLYKDDKL